MSIMYAKLMLFRADCVGHNALQLPQSQLLFLLAAFFNESFFLPSRRFRCPASMLQRHKQRASATLPRLMCAPWHADKGDMKIHANA
jgi:hypothetical protein